MGDYFENVTYEYDENGNVKKKLIERRFYSESLDTKETEPKDYLSVNIKKVDEWAHIPAKNSEFAAGYDLFACPETHDGKPVASILPGHMAKIRTGVAMSIPRGYFGAIYARSGIATKKGLRPANCVGVIDSDYRGEIIVALYNDSDKTQIVAPGDRIAQLIISPYAVDAELIEVKELDNTVRGAGGFGSTGE